MLIEYEVIPLAEMSEDGPFPNLAAAVRSQLSEFQCARSEHIQKFISKQALQLEKSGWTKTYIFLSPARDGSDGIEIPAFFLIGLTGINMTNENVSIKKSGRNKLLGGTPQKRDKGIIGTFCIADLARCDSFSSNELPGEQILEEAKGIISNIRELCGGRLLTIDARQKVFEHLYAPMGFREVMTIDSPNPSDKDEKFVTACCNISSW